MIANNIDEANKDIENAEVRAKDKGAAEEFAAANNATITQEVVEKKAAALKAASALLEAKPHTIRPIFLLDFNGLIRHLSVALVGGIIAAFSYSLVTGHTGAATLVACALLAVLLIAFVYLIFSPDSLRSQYTEQALAIASGMLEDITGGLTRESAEAICHRLLDETRAMTVSITDTERVLACAGEMVEEFPAGSYIHSAATHYVVKHGIVQSFTSPLPVRNELGINRNIPAGIIAPLRVRGKAIGTLKFYYRSPRHVNRTQYALASGFAELLSTQLTVHELERQAELTARAEVRALQAQINPHFLFNTLNTIAAYTRTEPLLARELLREFSQFYRATLENSGNLIPIKREVAQTMRYLTFEKARFGENRILLTVDIAQEVEDIQIPSFVIQPLVENAVRHAMPDEGPLHITIAVHGAGASTRAQESSLGNAVAGSEFTEAVDICVSDDGVGMEQEMAERLFDASMTPPDPSAPQGSGAGVAMHNISERIKRFYGPRSHTSVHSAPGEGTSIELHLDLEGSMYDDGVE